MMDDSENRGDENEYPRHQSGGGDSSQFGHHHHHHHHDSGSPGDGGHHRHHHDSGSPDSGGHHHHSHGHSFGRHHGSWRSGQQNVVSFAMLLGVLFVIGAAWAIIASNRSTAERMQTVAFEDDGGGNDDDKAKALKKKRDEGLGSRFVQVTKVIDGQSFEAVHNGSPRQVRIRGVECLDVANRRRIERQGAELNLDPDKAIWYGEAASSYVLSFVTCGTQIALRFPVDGPEPVDDTGALLAYVEAGNRDLGGELIRRGLAKASTENHPRLAEYRKLESEARRNKVGMFGAL